MLHAVHKDLIGYHFISADVDNGLITNRRKEQFMKFHCCEIWTLALPEALTSDTLLRQVHPWVQAYTMAELDLYLKPLLG